MELRVLGPIEMVDDEGARVPFASASQRRLVAVLAAHAGHVVRSEMLEDLLDLSPGALRTAVSRLRRIVGFDVLVTAPPGYELRTEDIDAVAFERALVDTGPDAGASRSDRLRGAIALWRGDAYEEFAHECWAIAESTRLGELHVGAVENLAESELHAGEVASAIARLDGLIAEHPFSDRPRGLLMQALAASGRQAEALRVFAEYRRLLAEEVGNTPGPELVDLDRQVATGARPVVRFRPLPSRLTRLLGRDDDLDSAADAVGRGRLTTLTGAGGCGKTSLALDVARRVGVERDLEVLWVELSAARNGDQVVDELIAGAGLSQPSEPDRLEQVVRALEKCEPTLIIFDNAEHVQATVAVVVLELLSRLSDCRVLLTSRMPLGIPGETVWRVPSLTLPRRDARLESELISSGAGELLLERVRSARPGLHLDVEAVSAMTSICHRVEGLPLALELAAGRMRALSATRVAAELSVSPVSLATGGPGSSDRHRTMRACIDWSFRLLAETDRLALRRLAEFVSSFDEDTAIAAVADGADPDTPSASQTLGRLVDANLVGIDEASGRYRLSEVTREFCRECRPCVGGDGSISRPPR